MSTMSKSELELRKENEDLRAKIISLKSALHYKEKAVREGWDSTRNSLVWLEESPVCTKIVDLDFNLQYMSCAGMKALGIDDISNYYGKPYPFSFYPDSFRNVMQGNLEKAVEAKEVITQEAPVVDINGTELWVHSTIIPVLNENNECDYLMVVSQDTTDRIRASQKMRAANSMLREAEKMAGIGNWKWYPDTGKIYLSKNMTAILEREADEIISPEQCIHPEDLPHITKAGKEMALNLDISNQITSFRIVTPDGKIKWLEGKAKIHPDNSGGTGYFFGTVQDITEQVVGKSSLEQSRIELVESERELRVIADNLPVLISRIDRDLRYLFVNQVYYDKSKFQDDIIGRKVVEVMGEDTFNRAKPFMQRALAGERVSFENSTINTKTGEEIIIDTTYIPHVIDGQIESFFVLGINVTERKLAERALASSEERFTLAMKASRDGLYDWDLVSNEIYYSPGWKQMLGYEDHELTNDFSIWENLTEPEDVAKSWEMQQEVINKQRDRFELEFKMKHKDGHWVDILSRAEAVFNEKDEAVRIVGTHVDITERKEIASILQKEEEKFRSISENAPVGIFITDTAGKTVYWNQKLCDITGRVNEEGYGEKWVESIHEDDRDRVFNEWYRSFEARSNFRMDYRFVDRLGNVTWTMGQAVPMRSKAGEVYGFAGTITDISELKQAENDIAAALLDAKQANSVKDQFIANISHEIRTPLNSIIGFSDLFKRKYGDNVSKRDQKVFGYITNASNRLMRTVDSILNLAQLSAGSITVRLEKLNLVKIIEAVIGELTAHLEEKNLELRFNPSYSRMYVLGDRYSIHQAILNLTENAIKYTFEGYVEIKVKALKNNIKIHIADTGIGISDEYKERIFEPYTQESEGFTKNFQGVGLGLALTKQYLELNNVILDLKSEKNVGTEFTLTFSKQNGEE